MATGMAIMGFGGGAMIGAPLAQMLMAHFRTDTSVGVWQTFVVMGADLLRLHDGRAPLATAFRPPDGSLPAGLRRRRT